MPAPHVLYIVTTVVVLGLIAWVIVVLSRPDAPDPGANAGPAEGPGGSGTAPEG